VDRYSGSRAQEPQRLGRTKRIEMTGRQSRAPAPDGQQHEVQRAKFGHSLEEIGVPGEIDSDGSADDITERGGLRGERPPPGSVFGVRGADANASEVELVPGRNLEDAGKPAPPYELARFPGNDHGQRAVELVERPEIQVVEVGMRDEDSVEHPERGGSDSLGAAQMPDPPAQRWVGDQARAVDLDDDRAVPEPGDQVHCRPLPRIGTKAKDSSGPAAFITLLG